MINQDYHQNDISDQVWDLFQARLPGGDAIRGGKARDNRLFINAVLWILRTGAPWRNLPSEYGDWKNTHRRFCRWRDKRIWELLLQELIHIPGFEWLMIDPNHAKVLFSLVGQKNSNHTVKQPSVNSTTRYPWPWMRMICSSECLLQRIPRRVMRAVSKV